MFSKPLHKNKYLRSTTIIISLFVLFFAFNAPIVTAQTETPTSNTTSSTTKKIPTKTCGDSKSDNACLTTENTVFKPLGNTTIPDIIGRIINALLGLVGIIALVMFIYGGFMWMTAIGNAERITKAKQTIIWSILGLFMIFSAYAIVKFVIDAVS